MSAVALCRAVDTTHRIEAWEDVRQFLRGDLRIALYPAISTVFGASAVGILG